MTGDESQRDRPLSEKINYLFETIHPRSRGPWSHPEVHRATGISTGTLSELRSGKTDNPKKETLQKLAEFFGVDPAYFFDTPKSAKIREQLDQVAALQALVSSMEKIDAQETLGRMSTLSSKSLRAVTEMIETLHGLEDHTDQ